MKKKNFKILILKELENELKKDDDEIDYLKIYYINKLLVSYCIDKFEFAMLLSTFLGSELKLKNAYYRELVELYFKTNKIKI